MYRCALWREFTVIALLLNRGIDSDFERVRTLHCSRAPPERQEHPEEKENRERIKETSKWVSLEVTMRKRNNNKTAVLTHIIKIVVIQAHISWR